MRIARSLLVTVLLCGASTTALAQPGPAKAPAPPERAVEGIVVTGAAAQVTSSIDRRSYSLGKDIAASSGSIADALRNVPAVSVDTQGALTLRGDANVTILVDGKPSAAFEGAGRADALQQFPADQIDRVEVITNPSAAMNPEGSGGIINLVTKPSKGSGWTGSTYVTAGSAGLKRAGLNFGYNTPKLSVTGALSGNYQRNKSQTDEVRTTITPATGLRVDHGVQQIGKNLTRGPNAKITVGYALTQQDQLTGNVSVNRILVYGYPFNHFDDRAPETGAITAFQDRRGKRRFTADDVGLSGGWRHTFGEGHTLSLDLVRNAGKFDDDIVWTTLRSTPPRPLYEFNTQYSTTRHSEIKLAYVRPLGAGAKLSAGYEFKVDDNVYGADVARGALVSALTFDPAVAYRYDYGQTINAAYLTLEKTFGDFAVQAGLRAEDTSLDINERSSPRARPDYTRLYPSLHLTYRLDDAQKLSASYSKRVQRPPAFLLNPFTIYADPTVYQRGNPNLGPQDTQSFEAAYERRHQGATYMATAYYRENKGEFTPILRDTGGGVYLATYDNFGSSKSSGLELVSNGKLSKAVSYSLNANLFWRQINAANLGTGRLSDTGVSGRANLDWQATAKDLLQINASAQGRRLFAQGFIEPIYTVNLGWRRKVTDMVTATVSVQDLFNDNRQHRLLDSATLDNDALYRPVSRAISLRLDYRFGAKPKAATEPGFEYGGAASGL